MTHPQADIFYSKAKVQLSVRAGTILEALNFGFSYIESEDHVVEYVVSNPTVMKKIFTEVPESVIKVEEGAVGQLWTAKLLLSEKLADDQILFSNNIFSAVINLNLNPDGSF